MNEVAANLAKLLEPDLRAVFTYLTALPATTGASDAEHQDYARFCTSAADCAADESCAPATGECVGALLRGRPRLRHLPDLRRRRLPGAGGRLGLRAHRAVSAAARPGRCGSTRPAAARGPGLRPAPPRQRSQPNLLAGQRVVGDGGHQRRRRSTRCGGGCRGSGCARRGRRPGRSPSSRAAPASPDFSSDAGHPRQHRRGDEEVGERVGDAPERRLLLDDPLAVAPELAVGRPGHLAGLARRRPRRARPGPGGAG